MSNDVRLWSPHTTRGGQLDTLVSSQTGNVQSGNTVIIPFNAYTFVMDMESKLAVLTFNANVVISVNPDEDNPKWQLRNDTPGNRDYGAAWRHINP